MEQLKNNLPIISIGLLIMGTINLMLYYSYFNIDILSYLDFTEVLQIQFRLFAIIITACIAQVLYLTSSLKLSEILINRVVPNPNKPTKHNRFLVEFDKRFAKYLRGLSNSSLLILLGVVVIIGGIIFIINFPQSAISMGLILSIFPLSLAIVHAFRMIKKESIYNFDDIKDVNLKADKLKYVLIYLVIVYVSGVIARVQAFAILSHKSTYEATVVLDKKTFATNKNYRYIGRTKGFTFFYDIAKKQAEVFPNGDIKNMFIRDGVEYQNKEEADYTFVWSREGFQDWLKRASQYKL